MRLIRNKTCVHFQWSILAVIALTLGITGMGTGYCFADETDPCVILGKVTDKYKSMETFSAKGAIVTEIDSGTKKTTVEDSISLTLKKPNFYLVSCGQGVAWSNGSQAFVYEKGSNSYSSKDVSISIAMMRGTTDTIPDLFFVKLSRIGSVFDQSNELGIKDIKTEKSETLDGENCYVISGNLLGKQMTFWISKKNFLILMDRQVVITDMNKLPEMSDAEYEKAMKSTGREFKKEDAEALRNIMKETAEQVKKLTTTRKYKNINTPVLSEKDFNYAVPQGTVLEK